MKCGDQNGGQGDQDDPPPPQSAKVQSSDTGTQLEAEKVKSANMSASRNESKVQTKRGGFPVSQKDQPGMISINKEKKIFDFFTRKSCKLDSSHKINLMREQLTGTVDRGKVQPQQKVTVEPSLYKGNSEIESHKQSTIQSAKSETDEGSLRSREAKVQQSAKAKVQLEDAESYFEDKVQPKFSVNLTDLQ